MDKYYVYIMSNERYTVLYTGFTNDLGRRMYEHKNKIYEKSFTKKYNVSMLLYYEECNSAEEAKYRENQIKRYTREFKRNLINSINPKWRDLSEDFNNT